MDCGEFEYAKKAIQYDVSEYMLKPDNCHGTPCSHRKNEEKSGSAKRRKTENRAPDADIGELSEECDCIRSRALQAFVENIKTREESLEELSGLGISLEAACYRVAAFDLDLYSDGTQTPQRKGRRVH